MRWLLVALLAGCSQHPTAAPDANELAGMTYLGQLVNGVQGGDTITLPNAARFPGDALIFQIFDDDPSATATSYTLSASGWTFTLLGTTATSAVFAGIAPDTVHGDFTITSTAPSHPTYINVDEFANVDLAGGSITFDAHASATCPCSGTCTTSLVIGHDGDAVWAGLSPARIAAVGADFTAGGSFGAGPHTEYRITSAPAGATESVSLTIDALTGQTCVLDAIAIKPR